MYFLLLPGAQICSISKGEKSYSQTKWNKTKQKTKQPKEGYLAVTHLPQDSQAHKRLPLDSFVFLSPVHTFLIKDSWC